MEHVMKILTLRYSLKAKLPKLLLEMSHEFNDNFIML